MGIRNTTLYTIFTGDPSASHWMADGPCFARPHEDWENLQTTHKRQSMQNMSSQSFVLNYIRFVLAGDLAAALTNFGGLAAQMSHLGALLMIATTENATTAMAYDKAVRLVIETNSRMRISDGQERS